jgi:16S rRNA (uracil1498-N3)-methyltransferase
VTLVQALAKGGRDEQAVEAAVELGVTAVMPWAADRAIVQWRGPKVDKSLAAWRALCLAAAKQSRRALVPEVDALVTTRQLAAAVGAATASGTRVLVLHEGATTPISGLSWADGRQPVWVVVGPEGGIADAELDALAAAGAEPVLLGPHVLRASSAGPAALAALAAVRGTWSGAEPTA